MKYNLKLSCRLSDEAVTPVSEFEFDSFAELHETIDYILEDIRTGDCQKIVLEIERV